MIIVIVLLVALQPAEGWARVVEVVVFIHRSVGELRLLALNVHAVYRLWLPS